MKAKVIADTHVAIPPLKVNDPPGKAGGFRFQ